MRKTEAETPKKLRGLIEKILSDVPRPGGYTEYIHRRASGVYNRACVRVAGEYRVAVFALESIVITQRSDKSWNS